MVKRKNEDISPQDNGTERKLSVKKFLVPILFALIFLAALFIVVSLISDNAEADYGLQVTVHAPQDKDMNASANPQFTNFTIEVENKGTSVENVNVTVTFDDPLKPAAGWTANPNNFTINSIGASAVVTREVTVTAPFDEPYPSFAQLTVFGRVQENTSQTSQDNLIARVSRILDVEISPSGPSSKSGDPGESLSFLIEVKNNGTSTDSYNIVVDNVTTSTGGDTGLWFTEIDFTPTNISDLPRGGITTATMNVDIPFPSDLSLVPTGLYDITVEFSSMTDSNIKETIVFVVNVQRIYWADIEDSVTTKDVDVGSSVQFSITITNKGNDIDNLSVEIEGDPAIPGSVNWGKLTHTATSQIDLSTLVDIQLAAGSSTMITLTITIPDRTHPSYPNVDPDIVTLKVIVKPTDVNGIGDNVNVTADINPIYEFGFSFLAETLDVYPGDIADFTMKIENKGTTTESFSYEIWQWEVDWSAYGYTFTPTTITIAASDIGEVIFTLNTPSDLSEAFSRDYEIMIKVQSDIGGADLFKNCTVFLEPVYDIELTPSGSTSKSVDVGDTVTYQFSVRNIGNIYETFQFSISDIDTGPGGGGDQSSWVTIYRASAPGTPVTSVSLQADESASMIMEFNAPQAHMFDFGSLTAPVQIEIEVFPESEPSVTDSFMTTTTINPIYSFELTTTAPANTKQGEPGDTLQFTLQIRNTGTATDSYHFRVTSIDETVFTDGTINSINNLGVDTYGTTTAPFTITSENDKALEGTNSIQITVDSQQDPGVSRTIIIHIEITPVGEVEITPVTQSDSGEPGDIIDYTIRVTNQGNAQDTFDLTLEGAYKEWGEILDNSGTTEISQVTLNAMATPGSFTDIIIRVTIPGQGETNGDQTYDIMVKAASRNTEGMSDSATLSTTVEQFVELALDYSGSGVPAMDYDPNKSSPTFTFKVTNNGNVPEDAISVAVDDMPSSWDFTPPAIETLEPGMASTFSIIFDIPTDEDSDGVLQVYATSSDGTYDTAPVTIWINITKPNLFIEDVTGLDNLDNLKSRVGNAVSIGVTVANGGTAKAESIQVKFYEENNVRGTKTISSLDPGESKAVTFRWTVVADDVELSVEVTPMIETDEGDNEYNLDIIDLRPDLKFNGEKLTFSISEPTPDDVVTIKALVENTGGNAEDVVIKFYEGTKIIGTDTLDIDFDETGEASVSWDVPDKPGETIEIRAEIDLPGAIGDGDDTTKSIAIGGINKEPELELVGNLVADEGETFSYTVSIENYDPQATYTFSDDTELFDINPATGNISFKPSGDDVGTHVVTITVTDDLGRTDSTTATFRILEEEEEVKEPFDVLWIPLIIALVVIMFMVGYFLGGKGKAQPTIPEEAEPETFSEIPPPPPPPANQITEPSSPESPGSF